MNKMIDLCYQVIPGCNGAADNKNGTFRIDFPDGSSRITTPEEMISFADAYQRSLIKPVTRRQFKLGLLAIGLLDDVEAAIAASGDRALQINYAEALDFDRSNPFVLQMSSALGKTDAEIDALFQLAASL